MNYQQTVSYFERLFDSLKIQNAAKFSMKLPWTPFHSALLRGDKVYIQRLFSLLKNTDCIKVLCSAHVDYKLHFGYLISTNSRGQYGSVIDDEIRTNFLNHSVADLYFTDLINIQDKYHACSYALPLTLACFSGDMEMFTLMLKNGASMLDKDSRGSNVIHSLVYLSKFIPRFTLNVYHKLIGNIGNVEEKYNLLTAENDLGFNPLDIAVKDMRLQFIQALLKTDGVYRFMTHSSGSYQHVLYDISRYEGDHANNPLGTHFLTHFALLTEQDLEYFAENEITKEEPCQTWITAITERNNVAKSAWAGFWGMFISLYLAQILIYYYGSKHQKYIVLAGFLLVISSTSLIREIYHIVVERQELKIVIQNWYFKGFPMAFKSYYRIYQLIFALLLMVTEIMFFSGVNCEDNPSLFYLLNSCTSYFGFTSLIIFSQMNPRMGHMYILFEKMVFDATLVLLIWFIFYLIYVVAFYLQNVQSICNGTDATLQTNQTMFSGLSKIAYEVVALGTGVITADDLYFNQSTFPLLTVVTYSTFLILFTILFLNLLIAMMTLKVSRINKYHGIIKCLQSLSLSMFLEKLATMAIVNPLKFSHYQKKLKGKHFVEIDGGKYVYLKVIETIIDADNES